MIGASEAKMRLSKSQWVERSLAFLSDVECVQHIEITQEAFQSELSDNAVKLVVLAGTIPGMPVLRMYRQLTLHPEEGTRAKDDLIARAMVREWKLSRKGSGGRPTVLELLEAGVNELKKRGIKPAEKMIKRGGWKHDFYARWIKRFEEKQGNRVRCEWTLGAKAFDLVSQTPDGKLNGIEICLSGSVSWNVEQAIKAASVDGVECVVLACEDKKLMKGISDELKRTLLFIREKIRIKWLGEYYPDGSDSESDTVCGAE